MEYGYASAPSVIEVMLGLLWCLTVVGTLWWRNTWIAAHEKLTSDCAVREVKYRDENEHLLRTAASAYENERHDHNNTKQVLEGCKVQIGDFKSTVLRQVAETKTLLDEISAISAELERLRREHHLYAAFFDADHGLNDIESRVVCDAYLASGNKQPRVKNHIGGVRAAAQALINYRLQLIRNGGAHEPTES